MQRQIFIRPMADSCRARAAFALYSLVDLQSVHVVILDTTGTGPHKLNCYLIASCTYYLTAYVDGMQEYLYIQKDNCQHDLSRRIFLRNLRA